MITNVITKTRVVALTSEVRPHIEHVAVLNDIVYPDGLRGQIAVTSCGLFIRRFWRTHDTSDYYTDGTLYKQPCQRCAKAEVQA